MSSQESDATMALFLDLENIALGARDAHYPSFDIQKVLERLLLKGHIVVKKAYCDFDRYKEFKRDLHEAAFELIEIPHVRQSGKNSADIRMVVDALDLCYTKGHVDTFVILSGDSDFSPLVSKLRENAKTVIGVGVKNSTSDLFISNCDEFLYYDDLVRVQPSKARNRSAANASAAKTGESNGKSPAVAEALDCRFRFFSRRHDIGSYISSAEKINLHQLSAVAAVVRHRIIIAVGSSFRQNHRNRRTAMNGSRRTSNKVSHV